MSVSMIAQRKLWFIPPSLGIILISMACGLFSAPGGGDVSPTPTDTPIPGGVLPLQETPSPGSACEGLSGSLEVMVLAGPAEVVGLEPYAIGEVPFSVNTDSQPYTIQGGGPISFADLFVEEWGTYEVTLDFSTTIEGVCTGDTGEEQLQLSLNMEGDQNVIVVAEGFSGEYPWSGTITRDLVFPLVEGAAMQGEGWAVVLHLNSP